MAVSLRLDGSAVKTVFAFAEPSPRKGTAFPWRRVEHPRHDRVAGIMVISSRTPEGSHNRCPVCGNAVRIEPSKPFEDAPCPHCGHLLLFANLPSGIRIFDESGRELAHRVIAERLGIRVDQVINERIDLGVDSLDMVELEMELSELDRS